MNVEKLRRLQSQVRIGGKGTARRKKKVMHQTATTDDKKLQSSLKKLSVSTIPGIEEVNIIKDDLTVIHFNNPKAQASLSANTFAVTGHGETKKIVEMLPEILPQLGQETVVQLRMFANSMAGTKKPAGTMGGSDATASTNMLYSVVEEDDVPMLVSDFDEVAKMEAMKVGEAATINNEQPATESEQTEKSAETNGEPAVVLPPLSQVKSNEKGNDVQPLEILNLNVKSNEETGLQNETEKYIKQQEINTEKENLNQSEKKNAKSTNDVGKTKEKQQQQQKSQQKQESSKQKVKSESKAQKSSKDNKKLDDIAVKATTPKAGGSSEVEETGKDGVLNNTAVIESKKSEQVTEISTNLKGNKDNQQTKQIQQKQQQKSAKQEPSTTPKKKEKQRGPLVEKQEKNADQNLSTQRKEKDIKESEEKNIDKQDELQQMKTSPVPIAEDGQQVKIEQNLDDQKKTQKSRQQQQQKNEPPTKQKNKQPQQKQQNQDNQNQTDAEKGFKSSEPLPKSDKQAEKQQIINTSKESSADKNVETKKTSNEKQSEDTQRNLKEASPNQKKTETPNKSSEQRKEVLKDAVSVAKDNKGELAPQEFVKEDVNKQKLENELVENPYKDNMSSIESGKQVKTDTPSVDVSIKTVALQSLESSEKMMQIVNEITKDLMIENLNKLTEETIKEGPQPVLPSDQQQAATIAVQSGPTEELPLKSTSVVETQQTSVNTDNQKSPSPLPKTSTEIVQDLVSNVDSLNKESDGKGVAIGKEELPSVGNEIVADSSSIMDQILPKVSEDNDKSLAAEKQISQEQMLQSTNVATPPGEQLAKQLSTTEIVQSLPQTIPLSTAQIPANNEVNNDKLITVDPAHKQPTMAEILQSQPPTIQPGAVLSLVSTPITGELKDIQTSQLLNKEDVKETQVDAKAVADEANVCKPQDKGGISPELATPSTDNVSVQREMTEEKSAPISVSPKQKGSPPKQTINAKNSNETMKQQTKPTTTGDSQKATGDAKLKLVTKPQTGQQSQQQQTSKAKSKPMNSNKSTPTTPTTPTTPMKVLPEKGTIDKQKATIPATKAAPDMPAKKANSPQKQQQTDTAAKSKLTPGPVSGKSIRPNTGNSGATTGSAKKANTPPAASKTNANTGTKQQDISKKGAASGTLTKAEQPTALVETKSAPTTGTTATTPPTSSPTIENTATSNKPSTSK